MRIFVTGASGFVGSNLVHVFRDRHGAEVVAPGHEHVDLTDAAPCAGGRRARPDAIVHAAIWNAFAALERDRARAWAAYVGATRNVIDAANVAGIPVVLVSTDWVFDGTQGPGGRGRAAEPGQRLRLPQGRVGARRHRARRRGIVARIAAVQGVHRARADGAARAGRGLRLPRRRARRHAARGRALHGLGRRGPQRARHADARDRRRRADLARARARRDRDRCTAAGASTPTGVGLARRAVAAFGLDPDLLDVGAAARGGAAAAAGSRATRASTRRRRPPGSASSCPTSTPSSRVCAPSSTCVARGPDGDDHHMSLDLITMGRVGVDLYPEQIGVQLPDVRTFAKSLGGTRDERRRRGRPARARARP